MKILKTHFYPSGNTLEIAERKDGGFDVTFYYNAAGNDDYDRWVFATLAHAEEVFEKCKGDDDFVKFIDICVAAGGM